MQKKNSFIILPKNTIEVCFKKQWVVYAKRPFSAVQLVVENLGRYTHKVAIRNHRITTINNTTNTITFNYKDYKDGAK